MAIEKQRWVAVEAGATRTFDRTPVTSALLNGHGVLIASGCFYLNASAERRREPGRGHAARNRLERGDHAALAEFLANFGLRHAQRRLALMKSAPASLA